MARSAPDSRSASLSRELMASAHTPVSAHRGLIALDGKQRRAHEVFHGGRYAQLGHLAQQFGIELIAVGIVHLFICDVAPLWLVLHLLQPLGVLIKRERQRIRRRIIHLDVDVYLNCGAVVGLRVGVEHVHGLCPHSRQSSAGASL